MSKSKSSRNIGTNYILAWSTGSKTHLSLIYLENIKRGYQQEWVKQMANQWMDQQDIPDEIELEISEKPWSDRCVGIINPIIPQIQEGLAQLFQQKGIKVRAIKSPHIDLRGQSDSVIDNPIKTRTWLH